MGTTAKHIHCPQKRSFHSFNRVILVMNRTCGTSQVVHLIHLQQNPFNHVMSNQLKIFTIQQMSNIIFTACEEIVQTDNMVASFYQQSAQMATYEPSTARHQHTVAFDSWFSFNNGFYAV
eukprot:TRINITY_DN9754_c1_g2_i6.p2 TRINITY_DN9754_c1_g2~~TRINITY_DN9754_c1_g2_i6.p2  ORF type:complete len:120 (+),score=0.69 TRINITY_DN9754_c1_g2_i6:85-444(+)